MSEQKAPMSREEAVRILTRLRADKERTAHLTRREPAMEAIRREAEEEAEALQFLLDSEERKTKAVAALGDAIRFIMSHPVDVVGTPDEAKRNEIIERLQATLNKVASQEGGPSE